MNGRRETESIRIDRLMQQSGVAFGTSGARGLVEAMTDRVCQAYTLGFLQYLQQSGGLAPGAAVAIAGDYRPSTPRIMAAVAAAVRRLGLTPVNCGLVPTPALALYGMRRGIPSIMVTGSHIPDDRNGIKFYRAEGEILKPDEEGIRRQEVELPAADFDSAGASRPPPQLPPPEEDAAREYVRRYLRFFPADALAGLRVGLYQHSSVARELLGEILAGLGAEVVPLGRSDRFVPVDTEAVRPEDRRLAREWAAGHRLDALASTDGDADRPLLGDERGEWLRGDVAGILCARYLGVERVVTPVSSNSAVEKCGWFRRVDRTRIGSPYVIAAMQAALAEGAGSVAGYEANGGFLTATGLRLDGRILAPLPTRDAVLVILALLAMARQQGLPLSGLAGLLPPRFTSSGRLRDFPTAISRRRIAELQGEGDGADRRAIEAMFGAAFGPVESVDATDGLRIVFRSQEVVHLRPSGNAPELRCYNEAGSQERADAMNRICLALLEGWREPAAVDPSQTSGGG